MKNDDMPGESLSIGERISGAFLGLACGDALGAPAEFKSQSEVKARWGRLTEMAGGGPWLPGEWTDDTGMALCVAQGILSHPEDPITEVGQGFLEWCKTAKDVGSTISAALANFHGDWPMAARNTPQAKSGKAAGNGSLMRILPVGLAYSDSAFMLRISARLSAMTHWDPQAEVCCAVYCLWVQNLLQGQSRLDAWHGALRQGHTTAQGGSPAPDIPGPAPLPDGFWERLKKVETLTYDQLQPSGYAGYVVECLEAAAWCVLHNQSYEGTVIQAVNLAGEADTIAAVAGGAAGAYWGQAAIPERWLDTLHRRADLEHIALRLATLRRHGEVYATKGLPAFNSGWVSDRIMAGRNPLTSRDVETLSALGITHILDLREPQEWATPKFGGEGVEAIERCGLQRLNLIIRDARAPTVEALETAYRFLEDTLKNPENRVYVHCRAGIGRTAAILVAYHARWHGVSYDEALSKLRERSPLLTPVPVQRLAVREWLKTQPWAKETPIRKEIALVWEGATQSVFFKQGANKLRQQLSDAAKNYEWTTTLKIVSESLELINTMGLDDSSLSAPLHHAAHGGAPLEVVEQLLKLGAWRTLRNAQGEQPLDVAVKQQRAHLESILKPDYKRHVPTDILVKIQQHFHEVIRGRISRIDHADRLRLPEIEPLLEFKEAKSWFAVPGMYGGFHYWLEANGDETKLIAESWWRIIEGSGQRHEVTAAGSRLTDEGFV